MQLTQFLCLCMLLILINTGLLAQDAPVIRTNVDGERIIVYPDGRTTYLNGDPVDNQNGSSYPVFTAKIEPLDGPVSITEEDIYKISVRRSQLAKQAAELAESRAVEAKANRERLEAALSEANASQDANAIAQLERRLQFAKRQEMESQVEARKALTMAQAADSITHRGGYIEDYNDRMQARQQLSRQSTASLSNQRTVQAFIPNAYQFTGWSEGQDLIHNPPSRTCQLGFDGIDPKSQQYRREVKPELLFTHTDERLQPYLKEKDYMQCKGYLHRLGGFTFLTLEFTFAYPNAREAYGLIEKNSILSIRMLNGVYILLRSGQLSQGTYDRNLEILTYRVYYPLDRSDLPYLRNSEADQIRVFWSSGYEEYNLRQIDFFKRQLSCLE